MSEINYEEVTDPMMLDSTGLAIVNKLEAIKNAVQPTNASTDIEISIPTDAWIADLPDYVCTWSNSHVTSGCSVEVEFLEGAENAEGLYLYFEKVTGGIRFTSPILPTVAIPLKVHILAADAESVAATSADQVTTSAVPNKANVEEALSSHQSSLTSLTNQIGTLNGNTGKVTLSSEVYYQKRGNVCTVWCNNRAFSSTTSFGTLPVGCRPANTIRQVNYDSSCYLQVNDDGTVAGYLAPNQSGTKYLVTCCVSFVVA